MNLTTFNYKIYKNLCKHEQFYIKTMSGPSQG